MPTGTDRFEREGALPQPTTAERVLRSLHARRDSGEPRSPHEVAAAAFVDAVRESLAAAVEDVYLFGSVARGTADEHSDVDVLAVVKDDHEFAPVDDQLLDIAYDAQLEHGVPVEVHAIRASEFQARKARGEPFIRTVLKEAGSHDD